MCSVCVQFSWSHVVPYWGFTRAFALGRNAFAYCPALPAVELGTAIESIGAEAFRGTSSLATSYELPNITTLGSGAFRESSVPSVVIGDALEAVQSYTFYLARGVTSLTVGTGLKTIGDYAFYGANELVTLSMGSGVESVGSYGFHACTKLSSTLSLPNLVTISR